jgi:hypothetical protein
VTYDCLENCPFGYQEQPGCHGLTSCTCNTGPVDGGPDGWVDVRCPAMWSSSLQGTACSYPGVRCSYGKGAGLNVIECVAESGASSGVWF